MCHEFLFGLSASIIVLCNFFQPKQQTVLHPPLPLFSTTKAFGVKIRVKQFPKFRGIKDYGLYSLILEHFDSVTCHAFCTNRICSWIKFCKANRSRRRNDNNLNRSSASSIKRLSLFKIKGFHCGNNSVLQIFPVSRRKSGILCFATVSMALDVALYAVFPPEYRKELSL